MDAIEVSAESLQWTILLALCLTVLAVVLAVLGLAYLVAVLMRRQPPDLGPVVPNAGLAIDSEAPVLVGQEVRTGETVRLSDYAGQVTVVAFVSPTCKPCVDLVRHLNALAKTRRHVRLIVVVLPGSGYDYGRNLGQSIRVLADTDGSRQNSWQVEITPLTYVIDGQGTVRMKSVSNDLLALEDTLDGYGWKQGDRPWVAVEGAQAAEPMPPHSPESGDAH